ncbi:MAG: DNA-protecting protein DprA [Gemmatimonadetes bacterium]|nr:DNA-protecting protein DprA [Gemmatimonadota bacterium]
MERDQPTALAAGGEAPEPRSTGPRRVLSGAPEYPEALSCLESPPKALFALGDLRLLESAPVGLVAIVGTRDASAYGLQTAELLASAVVRHGGIVVSGMARGVDAAAHRAAVRAGGRTIAVTGTGADVPYPASHRALHAVLAERGLVVSEAKPGQGAFKGCFPLRNRIIAALSSVTVVVEAGFKSGALNTATHALNLGRGVAAVPGRIDDPRADGCNLLIRDGAHPITDPAELLQLAGLYRKTTAHGGLELSASARAIADAVRAGADSADAVSALTQLPVRIVMTELGVLELAGVVVGTPSGRLRAA